ncbi:DNA-binding transcriptional activator FeaR [Edwardsiella tarda]|uniref:Helix-turn-helix domain-containing protein n=1 Tax=Edwardsiella tarda ATCC 15947 = NBRC 105688 TaxID=667121 RepID=A0AC61TMU8_EDWTA|nr:helix-turn-helix domain-containing protein [Edwardsiella tarda]UAL58205.1 helix-turn-helix domain-containing protein [Edwardsiella tarda]UCQ02042.1 helix-turn-helix domain-containing protein [Edwardsiella tarda ATCC 15947 = NBRC 105688]STE53091.1 DNA-binding transcriptional activator FeaR [Edwardsiella tarda]
MVNNYTLNACGESGIEEWSNVAKQKLGFFKADMKIPKNGDMDAFNGDIQLNEFSNKVIMVKVNSSPQQISLIHHDVIHAQEKHIILLHACSGLIVTSPQRRIHVPRGESILIPAWEPYVETCLTHRNSLSFIIKLSSVCDDKSDINSWCWSGLSLHGYGDMLNSLALQLYKTTSERYSTKIVNAIISILSLQLDNSPPPKKHRNYDVDILSMQDYIRSNMKKVNFSLCEMSNYYNLTPRAIQYKLKKYNIKFYEYLNKQRSELLLNKIIRNPTSSIELLSLESGFKSLSIAVRYFKINYNMTPTQYRKKIHFSV